MSNPYSQAYSNPPPNQLPTRGPVQNNSLGTAGFVVSLIGLFTCGLLSIFGLGLSLFGLRKNPKGLAIAGTVMGVIGLVELVLLMFVVYNTMQAIGTVQTAVYQGLNESVAENIARDVAKEWELTEQLPSEAEGQKLVGDKSDLYENEFRYETDGSSFTIRGAGEDQAFDTEDDITAGPFSSAEEVMELLGEEEEDFEFDMEDLEDPEQNEELESEGSEEAESEQ